MNYYSKAIEILNGKNEITDNELLVEIAKISPSVLCKAFHIIVKRNTQQEAEERISELAPIIVLLKAGRKVEAVKAYREKYGAGLKEAVDEINLLIKSIPLE